MSRIAWIRVPDSYLTRVIRGGQSNSGYEKESLLLLVKITHASYIEAAGGRRKAAEFGAIENGIVIWRAEVDELKARMRVGVRYFVQEDGQAIPIFLRPKEAMADPQLHTPIDSAAHAVLDHLPHLPRH